MNTEPNMTSQHNTVTQLESRGVIEARKLKSKIENAKRVLIETVIEIGQRYAALADTDKADFRGELGLSLASLQGYAAVADRYLSRAALLPPDGVVTPLEKSIKFAVKISSCSDDTFAQIVRDGKITLASSGSAAQNAITALSPVKQKIIRATKAVNIAARCINSVRSLMQKEGITAIRGPEVRQLREEFQLLCAELMAADPETVERAKQVLKGAA